MTTRKDYAELHRAMKALVEAQTEAGWANPLIERAMIRVTLGLWVCANNETIPQTILDSLKEDTAALEAARGAVPHV